MRDIDGLQVDTSLETFISSLQQVSISAAGTATATTSPREVAEEGVQGSAATAVAHKGHALGGVERVASPDVDAEGALIPWGVIPPPAPCFKVRRELVSPLRDALPVLATGRSPHT